MYGESYLLQTSTDILSQHCPQVLLGLLYLEGLNKALALAGHVPTKYPRMLGILKIIILLALPTHTVKIYTGSRDHHQKYLLNVLISASYNFSTPNAENGQSGEFI